MGEPAKDFSQRGTPSFSHLKRSREMVAAEYQAESEHVDYPSRFEKKTDSKRGQSESARLPQKLDKIDELLRMRSESEVFLSQRGQVTEAEIASALDGAKTFQSSLNSTSIVLVMDETSVYHTFKLDFKDPGFARMYMPLKKKRVKLVDENWTAWQCGWDPADERISGNGWYHFALQHCLEEHDALVLEILRDTSEILTMKVHIFSVVPILPDCTGWKRHICPPLCKSPELDPTLPIQPIPSKGPMKPRSVKLRR